LAAVALKRQAAAIHRLAALRVLAAVVEDEILSTLHLAHLLADLAVEQEATAAREHSQALRGIRQQRRHRRVMQEEAAFGSLSRDLRAAVAAAQVP